MDKITTALTTPEQAKRESEFLATVARLRADGHFTTTSGVGVGEVITVEFDGKKRCAEVAWEKCLDGGMTKVFFRWIDETPH